MKRRDTLALGAAAGTALALPGLSALAQGAPGAAAAGQKVLRYAFQIAETGFDPAQISDTYSRTVTGHIFEAPYTYDPLARPPKVVPLLAEAMPEVSEQFKVWTVKLKPGVFFADDPAFQGPDGRQVRREMVAGDFAYAFRRFADPANKSPAWPTVDDGKIIGLGALREQALRSKQAFDYDKPIDGIRLLDRHTIQFRLSESRPRFIELLIASDLLGAVAREVVEFYGDKISEHPVGTGPFKLGAWRRSSQIVLDRNPSYRDRVWHSEPADDDAEGQAIAAKLKGRRLPMVDRVEISIIEESQPRWLSFLNGQANFMERLPADFINIAMPGGNTAPNLVKSGIRGQRVLTSDVVMTYFNMEDPVIGGYTPEKVALRRAISLGVDLDREIRIARRGMAIPAQSPLIPNTSGYDPKFKSENSEYNPARAKALLDLYGYADKNGDGWRELPDGSPLVLQLATQPDQVSRQLNELWQKNMSAIGVKVEFKPAKWPENLKAARAGKLQMWGVASLAAGGDGQSILERFYGPSAGQGNLARFKLPAFDALFEKLTGLQDGPEREAVFLQAKRLTVAYVPYKLHCHRFVVDMMYGEVVGYRRPAYWLDWWHMVDVAPQPGGRAA